MKTLMIDGTPFHYEDESLSHETITAISPESGKRTLEVCKGLFLSRGLDVYLAFGTLLGAVRDKSIIKGDEDVDVYVEDEHVLRSNLPFFQENGLKLIRVIEGRVYSFRCEESSYIDVYILKKDVKSIWSFYCFYLNGWAMPKKYFKSEQEIEFLGTSYKCVKDPEELIAFWYGKNWRIPVRGHKFYYEVKSAYFWHNKSRIVRSVVQYCIGWRYWRHLVKRKYRSM